MMDILQKVWGWVLAVVAVVILTILLMLSKVENGKLESNIDVLNGNIETQQIIIDNYNEQIDVISDINITLSKTLSENGNELDKQQTQFTSNNLERLLSKKPQLIIKLANDKTKSIFDEYSDFTKEFESNNGDNDE